MGATPWYASRERVKRASEISDSAAADAEIDQACAAATGLINRTHHRCHYWPEKDTRYFDWPNRQLAPHGVLWLDANHLISLTSVTAGGVAAAAADWTLYPNDGPPYTKLVASRSGAGLFATGAAGEQNSMGLTGVFGYQNDTVPAGALAEALDISETEVDVTDGSNLGVGNLVELGAEYMVVTGRALVDTTVNTGNVLTDQLDDDAVTVADGTAFKAREEITVGTESMLILSIVGNTLSVRRGYGGTPLAAHSSGADIYAGRRLTVERAALGTTAATHLSAAAVVRWAPPAPIEALGTGLAQALYASGLSGQAVELGEGESKRTASPLSALWLAADGFRRKARMRSV